VKLIKLSLKNFKGCRSFTLETQGNNCSVYGDNATGKTTLYDAFIWLLFDKDSQNRKDFEIKTFDSNGQPVHGLEHSVEAELDLNGEKLTLEKSFYEKWTKKRGSAEKQFTGHTTDYYISGVPVKRSEYTARIAEIIDENIFKLLTNPTYFNEQLHWQERRKILLEVCGNVSDEEVIASDSSLSKLPEILGNRSIEQHRKVIQAKRAEINRELERIPVRIDEAELALPDITNIIPDKLSENMAKLKAEIQKKNQELARIESGGEIAEKTKQLRELEVELLALKNQHHNQYEAEIQEKQKLLSQAKEKHSDLLASIRGMEKSLELSREELDSLGNRMTTLRAKWHEVNNQQLGLDLDEVCPTCGQRWPQEHLEAYRERALAQFNREKAEKLEQVSAEGKRLKAKVTELEYETTELEKKIAEARKKLKEEEFAIDSYSKEIEFLRSEQSNYDTNSACVAKLAEVENVESAIENLRKGSVDAVAKVKEEIREIELDLATLEQEAAKVKQRKQGQERIEELKAQERELAAEYERLEQELYLTEQFIRAKVNLLEEKINNRFKYARFKLFDVQVNGAVVECCETMYQGVLYSSLNHGARINVGLDIINTLSEFYGFSAPIFIDNREAVTKLVKTKGQIISLIVSEPDKTLRVETENESEVEANLFKEVV